MDGDAWLTDNKVSYDTVAASYADVVRDALVGQPHLLAALSLFAADVQAAGGGPVADIGCGPGHVTAHLRQLGVDAFGIDLSPGMIEVAKRDHPGVRFEVGSMTELGLGDATLAGVVAWWSLIHVPDARSHPVRPAQVSVGLPGLLRRPGCGTHGSQTASIATSRGTSASSEWSASTSMSSSPHRAPPHLSTGRPS